MQIFILLISFLAVWSDVIAAEINGKGLLCTCSKDRAVYIKPPDSVCNSKDQTSMDDLLSCAGFTPRLECAHPMNEGLKNALTGDPSDVDSFFFFENNLVVEEVLSRHNDSHKYVYNDDIDDFWTSTHSIKWGDRYNSYVLDRKTLVLKRWEAWVNPVAVYQCQVFDSREQFEGSKANYLDKFQRQYQKQMRENRNQL